METPEIVITGARQHNLKNISLRIPRNRLVVITGLSGSGKSSLAFDTLFAEGQRRYMESLSAYVRQFLDQMQKPDVDQIEGLSPAIAIEQRSASANPRSTIATTTEIFDYLRLLFANIGKPHHPSTGTPLRQLSTQQVVDEIFSWPHAEKIILLAPLVQGQKGEFRDVVEKMKRDGFVRARLDGEIVEVDKAPRLEKSKPHTIEAVVDRLILGPDIRGRLSDSVETALKHGQGTILTLRQSPKDATSGTWRNKAFSNQPFDPETGESFVELTPRHFSFNSPQGACPRCHGLGAMLVLDENLVVSDPSRSLEKGAVAPWRRGSKRLVGYYKTLLKAVAKHYQAPFDKPWSELGETFQKIILFGSGEEAVPFPHTREGKTSLTQKPFEGVIPQMERLHSETESVFTRNKIEGYMSRRPCTICGGARFKPEILAVTVGGHFIPPGTDPQSSGGVPGKNIHQVTSLSVGDAIRFFDNLPLGETEKKIACEPLKEITKRLRFLRDVGLSYLTLDRESGTLSGGEAQRIRLATQIGSGLTSVLYILDEPSIGLHQRDNDRLIETLKKLRDMGNSVIVVEHDEDTIRAADHIIDLGPGAGVRGGHVVGQGTLEMLLATPSSLTGKFLSGKEKIAVPRKRMAFSGFFLTVKGARANNLKNIDARFPLGLFTCVTGVSGSGKSTLVNDILSRALFRHFYSAKERPGEHDAVLGLDEIDKVIEIDQSPIGKTPRSNPATYTGAFNLIRDVFSQLPSARVRGYAAGRFSFNVKGGRCENCQGDGLIKIPMHFLPDVYVPCDTCQGKRFNRETLEITYKGKNISDVLAMTVDEAADFFRPIPALKEKLETLGRVGLGYLRLGQSGDTLSGGEAQRVKLSAELAKKQTGRTVYLLDEPTTGLHFADVELLVNVLLQLREAGNTVIVIEHNLDVIKCADHLIDLGPEGGGHGGRIVAQGTPEEVARHPESVTGKYLAKTLKK